jgi:hypothetical protein
MEAAYASGARRQDSAFTWIDAILDLPEHKRAAAAIDWRAFPILANGTDAQIDANRGLQEEYVEWAVFRDAAGQVDEIVFTTEFREYFAVLAGVSPTGIQTAIAELNPGADSTIREIYGVESVVGRPAREREQRFLANLSANPWNNGTKGILALTTGVNSVPALFGLVAFCGIDKPELPAEEVCANVGGACVPGRQSDPRICTACQRQVREQRTLSLSDPAGIAIDRLTGIWSLGGAQIAINEPAANQGRWTISRNGRRARLQVGGAERLALNGDAIETGAQVARELFVKAEVITAADADLPDWARTGLENLRRPEV